MILEKTLEDNVISSFAAIPELEDVQFVSSRRIADEGETVSEDESAGTIIAVAAGFRQNDAFSLTPISVPVAVSIITRMETDPTSCRHESAVETVADKLSYWHRFGNSMQTALSGPKFMAGELRMDGGTGRQTDSSGRIWTDVISFTIRGSEKLQG